MYGGNTIGSEPKACRRDLEGEAKRKKQRLDNNGEFILAIEKFANSEELYQIDDGRDRKTLFAIYGDLKMRHPALEKDYASILEEIEKEK